jgi:hypothetical protein
MCNIASQPASQPSEHGVGRRDLLSPGRDREELTACRPLKRGIERVLQARRKLPALTRSSDKTLAEDEHHRRA